MVHGGQHRYGMLDRCGTLRGIVCVWVNFSRCCITLPPSPAEWSSTDGRRVFNARKASGAF